MICIIWQQYLASWHWEDGPYQCWEITENVKISLYFLKINLAWLGLKNQYVFPDTIQEI